MTGFEDKWAQELESGKYKQGEAFLMDAEGNNCCPDWIHKAIERFTRNEENKEK